MIKQSTTYWQFSGIPLDEFCVAAKGMGIASIELVGPEAWPVLRRHGMACAVAMAPGTSLSDGFCDPRFHDQLVDFYSEWIPAVAAAGHSAIVCVSGNRNGISDDDGQRHCRTALSRLLPLAEKHGVTLLMELLNSKVDHKDYLCDHTAWGAKLCADLRSASFKLLYDIYHMQIMEGDVIRTISENIQHIGHFHAAGNPGRHEIDEAQELNYPAIVRAIAKLGYTGYIGHEFVPKNPDRLAALRYAVELCAA
jgi:hydroxypyruvate isomerase